MLTEESSEHLRGALVATPSARAFVRTDGRGGLVSAAGLDADEALDVAQRIDLAMSAVTALGKRRALGELSTAMLEYREALLFVGVLPWGEHVAVLAAHGANVGLFLSKLRRLMTTEVHERGAA